MREIEGSVPERLAAWWEPIMYCLHSASWWRSHWEKMGIVDVELATQCPKAGGSGFNGKTWSHRRISSRFALSRPMQETISVTFALLHDDGRTRS